MRRLPQILLLSEPKNYPKVDKFQDLKVPKYLLQEMFLLIMSYSLKFIVFLVLKGTLMQISKSANIFVLT